MKIKIKNSALLFSIVTFVFIGCQTGPSFKITGNVNLESGTVYLQSFRNKMFFVIDSAEISGGSFSFKGMVDRPDLYGFKIKDIETFGTQYIFIENSPITVTLDTAGRGKAHITGSGANDLFEYYKTNRQDFNISSFIKDNPTSPVAAYVLYREFSYLLTADELEYNIALFDSSLKDISYLKDLEVLIEIKKKTEPGNIAINFTGITPDGNEVKLEDFRGNYLLLDFWASWCGPCRRENPNLVKAYKDFNPKGFQILAVSLDRKKEDWLKGIEKDQLTWAHVSDLKFWDSKVAEMYGIRAIPSNFLIDPQGVIVAKNLHGDELFETLSKIYSK